MLSSRAVRLLAAGAVGISGLVGIALFGAISPAAANEDPGADPPNCSAADLEGVRSGVSASTSAYLFTHPDVNNFFTSLKGLPRDQVAAQVKNYLASRPQVQADMTGIRQPLVDIKNRCGQPPAT